MSASYIKKEETLTARNIRDSYVSAYREVHYQNPECEHIEGRWFMVQGVKRDRHWLVLEVERLRQEALSSAFDSQNENSSKSHIFRMIRRLSRL